MPPENKLDFVPRVSFLPWEWRSLGTLFGGKAQRAQQLSSRCTFTLRQGFDPLDSAPTGRVLQVDADAGFSLRNESLALSVTLGNLMYRAGLDDPLAAAHEATSAASVPSLKVTLAKEYPEDQFVAVSYDLKQRKPELSACWCGETYTKKATLLVNLDPRDRVLRLGAALSLPGPEWRRDVYDRERDLIEFVKDDGLRHRVYVTHEARQGDLMHHTRMGLRLDVGRVLNYVADTIDWDWEERIPSAVWRLPLLPRLYGLLIPPEDENQMRYYIKGWELDVSHDFSKSKPAVALVKNYAHAAMSAGYDFADKEASVEYSRGGVRLGAKVARTAGTWGRPALTLHVEPLSLL